MSAKFNEHQAAREELIERLYRACAELHDAFAHSGAFDNCRITSCLQHLKAIAKAEGR